MTETIDNCGVIKVKNKSFYLQKPFEVKNGGNSEWSIAINSEKKKFFIKRLLSPKMPPNNRNPKKRNTFIKYINQFDKVNRQIILSTKSYPQFRKNIIYATMIFPFEGFIYKVTPYLSNTESILKFKAPSNAPYTNLDLNLKIMLRISELVRCLHEDNKGNSIIHADLKPDNILISTNKVLENKHQKRMSINIIDFDDSLIVDDIQENTTIVRDLAYTAPEIIIFSNPNLKKEIGLTKDDITTKVDIFSLGILFARLVFGKVPIKNEFNLGKDSAVTIAMKNGFIIPNSYNINKLINQMLEFNYEKRPDILEVQEKIKYMLDKGVAKNIRW